jgi:ribosomal protein S8
MLTRIRNAEALHEGGDADLEDEGRHRAASQGGYIRDYHVEKGESFDTLVIDLKFGRNRERVISGLKRVSAGRQVYARKERRRAAGRDGRRDPVHVVWSRHRTDRGGARHRRRGRVLHLVTP